MTGRNGFALAARDREALGAFGAWLGYAGVTFDPATQMSILPVGAWILALLPIVFYMPNTQQIMGRFEVLPRSAGRPEPIAESTIGWRPTFGWAFVAAVLFTIALLNLTKPSEFLYFQF
jgi:hypothetical protein